MANTGPVVIESFKDTIPQSSSKSIDTVSLSKFEVIRYLITALNETTGKSRTFHMDVSNQNGSLKDNVFGRIGRGLTMEANTSENSGSMELEIINHEVNDLSVKFNRIII